MTSIFLTFRIVKEVATIKSCVPRREAEMSECHVIQDALDQAVTKLLGQGYSPILVGLELLLLGTSLTTKLIGADNVARHLRRLADALERSVYHGENDKGYSALG